MPNLTEESMIELTQKVEVSPDKCLNINNKLNQEKNMSLLELLKSHKQTFAWDYHDMKGLYPKLCT